MRIVALLLTTLTSAALLGAAAPARAAERAAPDHADHPHAFVTILPLKVRPDVQRIHPGDAFGWLNYTNRIARVSFDREVAKHLTCRSEGSFRLTGDRLQSGDIQAQQFATLCSLAPGEYPYRVELRTGVGGGGGGGVTAILEGKIVVE